MKEEGSSGVQEFRSSEAVPPKSSVVQSFSRSVESPSSEVEGRVSCVGCRESQIESLISEVLAADGKVPDRLTFKRRATILGTEWKGRDGSPSRPQSRLLQWITNHRVISLASAAAGVVIAFVGLSYLAIMSGSTDHCYSVEIVCAEAEPAALDTLDMEYPPQEWNLSSFGKPMVMGGFSTPLYEEAPSAEVADFSLRDASSLTPVIASEAKQSTIKNFMDCFGLPPSQ